jgi:transcriptional regulator NrdR family protein
MLAVDVVKRGGERPSESFERIKLERSIHAALLSVRTPDGQAEDTARRVTDIVEQWLAEHTEVTSYDIRLRASGALEQLHPDAAYLYKHHKVIM